MADAEQYARIRWSVKEWNAWREKNPDVQVDLREAMLQDKDLREASLFRADLRAAVLNSANLNGANLRYAQLSARPSTTG